MQHTLTRGTAKLSPCLSHIALHQPVSILQSFLIAIVRKSESNLGCGMADAQESALLVGAVPDEGAIRAEAAVATRRSELVRCCTCAVAREAYSKLRTMSALCQWKDSRWCDISQLA